MARPLRLEFPGAVYHLTARGDRQEPIFLNDADRRKFLDLLAKEVKQQDWLCYAYYLMDNHCHLLIETPQPTLVAGMRRAQRSHRGHAQGSNLLLTVYALLW